MRIDVLCPGPLTTVQDLGRTGHAASGVGAGGAVDAFSHTAANLLVGNAPGAATLEITLAGPRLRLGQATRIALCGADIDARVDGVHLPGWRPIDLPAGSELMLGACGRGCRAYLAIAGGVPATPLLGSRSTDLRGGFGGFGGRALQTGDVLEGDDAPASGSTDGVVHVARWWVDPRPDLDFERPPRVGVVPGHHVAQPEDALFDNVWTVSKASDRQGLRLEGPVLEVAERALPSEPVLPGTIQLPPDGQPIVLLADAQTVGGYPRIGHVARAHLPRLAQVRPGDRLAFAAIGVDDALEALIAQRQRLARMRLAIQARRAR